MNERDKQDEPINPQTDTVIDKLLATIPIPDPADWIRGIAARIQVAVDNPSHYNGFTGVAHYLKSEVGLLNLAADKVASIQINDEDRAILAAVKAMTGAMSEQDRPLIYTAAIFLANITFDNSANKNEISLTGVYQRGENRGNWKVTVERIDQ